jgi:hypothetical protein
LGKWRGGLDKAQGYSCNDWKKWGILKG